MLAAVAKASEIRLVKWNAYEPASLMGVLFIQNPGHNGQLPNIQPHLPSFKMELVSKAETFSNVKFSNSPLLPPLLRERWFNTPDASPALKKLPDGGLLAKINDRPVWAIRNQDGARHDINVQAEPRIVGEERLFEHLNGRNIMRLLPLIEWFRSISNWAQWQKPPIRACFMFG